MSEALPYVGAAIGSIWGQPQLGWAIGSVFSMALAPTQKSQGPRLDDLKVVGLAYGQTIPYIQGTHRTAGQLIWSSDRREIATRTRGGKGGSKQQNTTYTYETDCLYLLSSNELDGLLRVWDNGKLVFTAASDASTGSLVASQESELWRRITFYGGSDAQLPDPTYEAAVGAGNAPAYRGMATVFIEGLQLGQSGQQPNLSFEVGTNLTPDDVQDYQDYSPRNLTVVPSSFGGIGMTVPSPAVFDASLDLVNGDTLDVGPAGGDFIFPTQDFTIRGWAYRDSTPGATRVMLTKEGDIGNSGGWSLNVDTSARLQFYGLVDNARSHTLTASEATPYQQWFYFEVRRYADRVSMFQGLPAGLKQLVATATGVTTLMNGNAAPLGVGRVASGNGKWVGYLDDVAIEYSALAFQDSDALDAVPDAPYVINQGTAVYLPFFFLPTVVRGYETVRTVVERLCARAELPPGAYDASALDAITTPLRALAITQVGGTRATMELLAQAYHFQVTCTDRLYFVPRAQGIVAEIPYIDLGATEAMQSTPDPLALRQRSDIEVPAQEALTYANVNDDYQTDTQFSDRLMTDQTNTSATTVPLALTPSEAKAIADARVTDGALAAWSSVISLPPSYSRLMPGDSVLVEQKGGSVFRMLLGRLTNNKVALSFEARLEDPTVFLQSGITGEDYNPQTVVATIPGTYLEMLDIPQLRDADNGIGLYAAARGLSQGWPGAGVFESTDTLSWDQRAEITETAVMGSTVTALGDWSRGNVFDETNTLDVDVGFGSLSSATRDQVLESRTLNSILVGNEVLQYCVATALGSGVYRLSRLLRGRLGTDRVMTGHAVRERFVLLQPPGMRRVSQSLSDLAALRYFKGVSIGRALSTAATQPVVNRGVSSTPLAPVNARANRNTSDTGITWQRRTRMETRFLGPLSSSVPLGEVSEAYQVDIYSDNTFTTVVRTLTTTAPNAVYTAAQQTTDFGSPRTVLYVRIYQMSEVVGRGFPLTAII